MKRFLALDYGRRRVGTAISDPLGLTAQPAEVLDGRDLNALIDRICALVEEKDIDIIIVGYPLHMSGESGQAASRTARFAKRLERAAKVPVELRDERLTSVQARKMLQQMGIKPSRDKSKIDALSAALILQNALDRYRAEANRDAKELD